MLLAPPAAWVRRFAGLIAPAGRVLDLACGSGRHAQWLAAQGWQVTGVDRDAAALAALSGAFPAIECITADIESGPWPLAGRRFDGIVVTNYLWRPIWPQMLDALAEGGVLIYETFAAGHEQFGRPSRPDFLLQPGELLQRCAGLRIVAFEDGFERQAPRCVQRIVAVRPAPAGAGAALYGLDGAGS